MVNVGAAKQILEFASRVPKAAEEAALKLAEKARNYNSDNTNKVYEILKSRKNVKLAENDPDYINIHSHYSLFRFSNATNKPCTKQIDVLAKDMPMVQAIYNEFIKCGASNELNLSDAIRSQITELVKTEQPIPITVFDKVIDEVMYSLYRNTFSRYKRKPQK